MESVSPDVGQGVVVHKTRGWLLAKVLVRLVAACVICLAVLLLSAGTVSYWEAWVFMLLYLIAGTLVWLYLFSKSPELAERRMKKKEKDPKQRFIRKVGVVCTMPVLVVPGLDRRFGWSDVPMAVVVVANVLVLLTYAWFILVVRENKHASSVIEVQPEQRVVMTGPYGIVRHPMYLGWVVFYLSAPFALGSWWAALTVLPLAGVMVARTWNEERLLVAELAGYRQYMVRTKYRLVPLVW